MEGFPYWRTTSNWWKEGDPLAGEEGEHIGKVKLYAWRGPDYIDDPDEDEAGVGWILAENWWPYQRPTFITPPFAGYVSGHSTFSRAAAEVLTLLTGDAFFPGGMGEFEAKQNEFLVFEEGPSVDVTLQWATYRDASDQTSLSRIWGGIHPPADDIPGRLIGEQIGIAAFHEALEYFNVELTNTLDQTALEQTPVRVFPNPANSGQEVQVAFDRAAQDVRLRLYNAVGQVVQSERLLTARPGDAYTLPVRGLSAGHYVLRLDGQGMSWDTSLILR